MPDRPILDPARHFGRLISVRHQLHLLCARYPSRNRDWQVFQDAADALDRAAGHFGLGRDWWWRASAHGGRIEPGSANDPDGGR